MCVLTRGSLVPRALRPCWLAMPLQKDSEFWVSESWANGTRDIGKLLGGQTGILLNKHASTQ